MNDFRNQSPWGTPPPGGGGNGDGGFRRGPTPPNLDEILKKLQDTINKFLPGKSGGAKPIVVGLIILALLWIGGGLYRVLPDDCLLYTSPSPRDRTRSRMPSSA